MSPTTSRRSLGALVLLALVGCPSPWVHVVLATGALPESTLELGELTVVAVTATVPAAALPAALPEGWWGELEVWVSGWEQTDELWLSLTDCADAPYDSYDVTEFPEVASMGLRTELFADCAPQQDCSRTICLELQRVDDGVPLELGWAIEAKVHDQKQYHGESRKGRRELEEHPVPEPLDIDLYAEVL